jgi:hypothetical protein
MQVVPEPDETLDARIDNPTSQLNTDNKSICQDPQRVLQMKQIQNEGLALFKKKNQDYGDAFATYGPIGVLVRMGDKISRLQSITRSGINLVDDECLRDTLLDLHNYSAMAIMLLDDKLEVKSV